MVGCSTGGEALKLLHATLPERLLDVVLLDYSLQDMSAFEVRDACMMHVYIMRDASV